MLGHGRTICHNNVEWSKTIRLSDLMITTNQGKLEAMY